MTSSPMLGVVLAIEPVLVMGLGASDDPEGGTPYCNLYIVCLLFSSASALSALSALMLRLAK